MPVEVGSVFLLSFDGSWEGQRILLTHTYEVSVLTGATDAALVSLDILDRVSGGGGDLIETSYLNCLPQDYNLNAIHCQMIYGTRYRKQTILRDNPGNIANNALTGNNAAVLSFHTELAGRSQVANKHIGPLATAVGWFTQGELTAGYKAVLNTLRAALSVDIGAAGWYTVKPCIYHKADVVPKSDYITGSSLMDTVRTQRRRTVGFGE